LGRCVVECFGRDQSVLRILLGIAAVLLGVSAVVGAFGFLTMVRNDTEQRPRQQA
jgi:hypothetical protein